jgi:outer membrane protein assembly factor BamB
MRRLVSLLTACALAAGCGSDNAAPSSDASVDATGEPNRDGGTDASIQVGGQDASIGDSVPQDGAPGVRAVDASPEPEVDAGHSVLRHHKNRNRDGLYVEPTFTKAAIGTLHKVTTFNATLGDPNDNVYAQPLFVDGLGGQDLVIVATEGNNVYALDATTGTQVWAKNVGTPVPQSDKPCGDLGPYGITGTPVIDFASRTLFFDAELLPQGSSGDAGVLPVHQIFALSIDTGAMKAGWPVDVRAAVAAAGGNPPFNSPYHGQRGALAVLGGMVYVPYAGLYGSCTPPSYTPNYPQDTDPTPYHGWVVGVSLSDPTQVRAWSTVAAGGGAWPPGGVASDGVSLYVSTGTTFLTDGGWAGGNAVMRLGAGAGFGAPVDYFAPGNWYALDNYAQGFGTAPVVFDLPGSTPGQLAIVFDKGGNAYLLDRAALGGIGGALDSDAAAAVYATLHVATAPIISAPVVYTTATAAYVAVKGACGAGTGDLTAVKLVPGAPPTLAPSWCALSGAGSPMVTTSDGQSDAIVWQLGAYLDNRLHAFDGDTGAAIPFTGSTTTIPAMRPYNTPIAAKGRIYVPADKTVVAFSL